MLYTDLRLAELQAQALFVHDEEGRLLRINEPDPEGPAPSFFLSRTREGNLWRTRFDLPSDLAAALEQLAIEQPINANLRDTPLHYKKYVSLLEQYAPITSEFSGPAYYLPELPMPQSTIHIKPENAALLQANYPYTMKHLADFEPVVAIVADSTVVALCRSVRLTQQAAEAGVDTEPNYRGRGYAALVTQAWAAYIRAANRIPLYSTDWDNMASQAVARKLGAIMYASTLSLY